MSVYLTTLSLSCFRSYESLRLEGLKPGLVVLYGKNGAGKTNVLEAVSLLVPGRGVRGAKNQDIQNRTQTAHGQSLRKSKMNSPPCKSAQAWTHKPKSARCALMGKRRKIKMRLAIIYHACG